MWLPSKSMATPSTPTRVEFKDLEGERLTKLQLSLSSIYIIIDNISMVGRKTLGQVDRRLHQAFPHHAQEVFRRCSCLLFSQLPPVMDLPLYTTDSHSELSDQGKRPTKPSTRLVVLGQVMHQAPGWSGPRADSVL